ncbi:MAG: aldolase/citrate lyase family protein [Armatimonadetes bacterium]|nr:aldolase/citrate lyase family protein [Armatimonadota bacterium]
MNWIRDRVLNGERVCGTWLNLGSAMTAEIAALAGFDWVVLDLEHGAGDHDSLTHQIQAVSATPAAPIVRIAWNEAPRFKRVLDLGCAGIVVPYVTTPAEAEQAVASMRYPPQGIRGAASLTRAAAYGKDFAEYLSTANQKLLTVVQIETEPTLDYLDEIAAVDGVDVLFIGPLDLSVSMGIPAQFDHPRFRSAVARVNEAARRAGKAAGILLGRVEQIEQTVADGFTFIGIGSDGSVLANGMRTLASAVKEHPRGPT